MEFEFVQNSNPQYSSEMLNPETYTWEILDKLLQCQEDITRTYEEWQEYQGTEWASSLDSKLQAMFPALDKLEGQFQERFDIYFTALLDQIQKAFLKIQYWRQEQEQLYQGKLLLANVTSSLDDMGVHFEFCTNRLWCLHELLKKTMRIHLDLPAFLIPSFNLHTTRIHNLRVQVINYLKHIVAKSLIVKTQPSQIPRISTLTKATVKHLVGDQLRSTYPIQVFCYLLDEIQALELCSPESLPQRPSKTCCKIARNDAFLEISRGKDASYCASWQHAMLANTITRLKGEKVPGIKTVSDENNWFYYHCEWTFDDIEFKASAFSFPVKVVTSTVIQFTDVLETALWDVATGKLGVSSVTDRANVTCIPWVDFACALSALFYRLTKRGLTEQNMLMIAAKMWSPQFAVEAQHNPLIPITLEQFRAINVTGFGFTPAKWIFSMLKVITECLTGEKQGHTKMPSLWADGPVWGFVTEQNVADILRGQPDGTFIIRFSYSTPGALTVDCLINGEITSSRETMGDLKIHPILKRIAVVPQWEYLLTCTFESVSRNDILAKYAPRDFLTPVHIRHPYVRLAG